MRITVINIIVGLLAAVSVSAETVEVATAFQSSRHNTANSAVIQRWQGPAFMISYHHNLFSYRMELAHFVSEQSNSDLLTSSSQKTRWVHWGLLQKKLMENFRIYGGLGIGGYWQKTQLGFHKKKTTVWGDGEWEAGVALGFDLDLIWNWGLALEGRGIKALRNPYLEWLGSVAIKKEI